MSETKQKTEESGKPVGLYKKLWDIQKSVRGMAPDALGGNTNYRYISGNKILPYVRAKMDDLKLLLIPEVLGIEASRQDYFVQSKSGESRPKNEMYTTVNMSMTWVDVETGEERVCLWAGAGQNGWDKGFGSALTYAERYFLLKFFHIPTDMDDVDAIVREEEQEQPKVSQAPTTTHTVFVEKGKSNNLTQKQYNNIIKCQAEGTLSQDGMEYKDAYRVKGATAEQVEAFMKNVAQYRKEHPELDPAV